MVEMLSKTSLLEPLGAAGSIGKHFEARKIISTIRSCNQSSMSKMYFYLRIVHSFYKESPHISRSSCSISLTFCAISACAFAMVRASVTFLLSLLAFNFPLSANLLEKSGLKTRPVMVLDAPLDAPLVPMAESRGDGDGVKSRLVDCGVTG